jgi:predicted permease
MESFLQDLKFGAKLLWKDKGFATTAVATLAICIAANTAIFSVIHAVVLKPLPLPEADRILTLYNSYPNVGVKRAENGVPDFYDRRRALTALEDVAMYNYQGLNVGEGDSVQRTEGMGVTPSLFRLLRAKPLLGRIFTEDEGEIGNERKAILSYSIWQELYGGDRSVVGKDMRIYGNPYTIVGVMPEDFLFLSPEVRLWRPLAFTAEQKQQYHSNSWEMIGRLKPGATIQQVRAQVDALNKANLEIIPQLKPLLINAGFHTKVFRLQDEVVRDIKGTLYLLWGGALFVLLIGAVNIANLTLARSSARMKELATRFALGAGRWRVGRQMLTESLLLTILSALIGLVLGWWGMRVFTTLRLNEIPRGSEIVLDGSVVLFILVLAVLVGTGIGFIPMLHTLRADLNLLFRSEGRAGTSGRGARLLRNGLVVAQIAFALILLVGAGLLLASFRQVLAVKPGFDPKNVLTGSVALPSVQYKGDQERRTFMGRALEKIRALPGTAAAGATDSIPFGDNSSDSVIFAEGYVMKPGESVVSPNQIVVTPGYFEAMRVPLIEGRFFDARDTADSLNVILVDQRLARKFWPGSSPVGRRMWRPSGPEDFQQPGPNTRFYTVVGVVGSVKLRALVDPDERVGAYYFPYDQSPRSSPTFAVRTAGELPTLIPSLRKSIREVDAGMPLFGVRTMQERIDESLIARKSPMVLAMGFGLVALFLAGVGIYGVLAYTVAQRAREIGIRMALGSTAQRIFKLVIGEGFMLLGAGFALGLAGTYGLAKYVESLLFGIRPMDPYVLAGVAALLALAAIIACFFPAQRAAHVDPVVALRQE